MTTRRKALTDVQKMANLQAAVGHHLQQINEMLAVPGVKLALVVIHPTEPEASFLITDAAYAEIRSAMDKFEMYDAMRMAKGKRLTA